MGMILNPVLDRCGFVTVCRSTLVLDISVLLWGTAFLLAVMTPQKHYCLQLLFDIL